jgi:hypothetical protein
MVVFHQHRHQVLGSGQNENVRQIIGVAVVIAGKALVDSPGDGGQRQAPAETECAVARPGTVAQRKLRSEPRSSGTDWQRDAERSGSGRGIGDNVSSMPRNAPPPLGAVICGATNAEFSGTPDLNPVPLDF